jgi:cell division protein FtsB
VILENAKKYAFRYNRAVFDFHQKRKLRSVLNAPITQGFLLVLVCWAGYSAYERFVIAMEMQDRREIAEAEAAVLQARKAELEAEVEYLSNERGIEAEVRRQFDVALPGEQVVVIVDENVEESEVLPLATTSPEQQETKRWYQFWR